MSTRLLLDGQDLRALMLRVRDEMGPGARIVRAERVRTGGIAGFFAREHYELTVEVPDPPTRRPAHTRQAPEVEPDRPAGHTAEPVGLDALLAAADALEVAPEVSTSSDSFAEVLMSMQRITADGPVREPAPPVPALPVPAPPAEAMSAPAATGGPARMADVDPLARPAWVPAPPPPVIGRPTAPEPAAMPPVPDLAPEPDDVEPERPGSTVAALLELGVPTRLLARWDDGGAVPLSGLVRTFDRPPAPLLEPGALVVVAGPAELAVRTAVAMAQRAGLDSHDVVLAGDLDPLPGHGRRVQTTAAAARVRAKAGPGAPTVVALGVGAPAAGALLLSSFEPDQAWAAVDARLRGVELRRWLRAVGTRRAFDAVAAQHVFEAQSPGTVLNLGIPVGWIDVLPASPVVWAAVLGERLSDDARWD